MTIRLIIADDHPLILDALENLFRLEPDLEVAARCTDGHAALLALRRLEADIAILDIRMPGKSGLEVLREIQQEGVPVRVILLTADIDEDQLVEAITLGVHGVILKEMAPQLLVQCIRKVEAGGRWIEREASGKAMEKMLLREAGMREMTVQLTPREIDIMRWVVQGLKNREIGDQLFISEGTVKIHLHNVYEKLGISGRMALARYAQEKGLV